jgi:site-specific recombinase XerD
MLQQIYRDTHRVRHLMSAPLGEYLSAFARAELDQGFARLTLHTHLRVLGKLNLWLQDRGIVAQQLSVNHLKRLQRDGCSRKTLRRHGHDVLARFLRYLQTTGVAKIPEQRQRKSARNRLLDGFERYLREQRGLSKWTIGRYTSEIRKFLKSRKGALRLRQLRPSDIYRYVIDAATRTGQAESKRVVTALRSFLRWLTTRGAVSSVLQASVPMVANRKLKSVPAVLTAAEVNRLVRSCNLRTTKGRRDRAIILLLARLGLRAGEVVSLRLNDINWQAGVLCVRRKGGRADSMPLPPEVGTAVACYLRNYRPKCSEPRVFTCVRAPHRGLGHSSTVSSIVATALRRAGLNPPNTGAHLLRHTLASSLLGRGAGLGEIGQLLGHQAQASTEVYSKVDIRGLRSVAQPWPGGAK